MKADYERIAGDYRKARPPYPERLVATIAGWLPEGPVEALDVGAGTGIGTRALAGVLGSRASILAVEPSPAMRREAEAAPGIRWIDGRAEALPARDASVDLVFSAQALHWFDRPAFWRECGRVLKPGGAVAILYNNRDYRRDAFASGYEDLLERHSPGYRRDYREFDIRGELAALDWTASTHEESEIWTRRMRPRGLHGDVALFVQGAGRARRCRGGALRPRCRGAHGPARGRERLRRGRLSLRADPRRKGGLRQGYRSVTVQPASERSKRSGRALGASSSRNATPRAAA